MLKTVMVLKRKNTRILVRYLTKLRLLSLCCRVAAINADKLLVHMWIYDFFECNACDCVTSWCLVSCLCDCNDTVFTKCYCSVVLDGCDSALGMQSLEIPDSALTASSQLDADHGPQHAR